MPRGRISALDDLLVELTLYRLHQQARSDWNAGTSGFAATDVGELERIVRTKERRLSSYRNRFLVVWLLIYSAPPASGFLDFERLQSGIISTTFDGVAYVDLFTGSHCVLT